MAIDGDEASRQAVDAAEAVDAVILGASEDLLHDVVVTGFEGMVDRATHREPHLVEIEGLVIARFAVKEGREALEPDDDD